MRRKSSQRRRFQPSPEPPAVITDQDLEEMAEDARALGFVTKELVIERLRRKIARDYNHLKYHQANNYQTTHDEITAEDDLILALVIQMLREHP